MEESRNGKIQGWNREVTGKIIYREKKIRE